MPEINPGRKRKHSKEEESLLLKLKNRKETLLKKSKEIAIKSDVEVCLVCLGPNGEIDAWPEPENAKAILNKYKQHYCTENKNDTGNKENLILDKSSETQENYNVKVEDGDKSLWTLLADLDSKLETLDAKIKKLNEKAITHFSGKSVDTDQVSELIDMLPLQSVMHSEDQPVQPLSVVPAPAPVPNISVADESSKVGFRLRAKSNVGCDVLDTNTTSLLIDNPHSFLLYSPWHAWV